MSNHKRRLKRKENDICDVRGYSVVAEHDGVTVHYGVLGMIHCAFGSCRWWAARIGGQRHNAVMFSYAAMFSYAVMLSYDAMLCYDVMF